MTGLVILLIIFISCQSATKSVDAPNAVLGILDLRTWNFEEQGIVKLAGEWEFYWNQLLTPSDFLNDNTPQKAEFKNTPAAWNSYKTDKEYLPVDGYATYRLRILLPKSAGTLGIRGSNQESAYKMWLQGNLILSNGLVAATKDQMVPQRLPKLHFFKTDSENIDVIVQVSNFNHKRGGLFNSILLGPQDKILAGRDKRLMYAIFLFGSLFIMGLYHLGLFSLIKNDYSSLLFGIFSLLISLRPLVTGENILIFIFPDFNWELAIKLEYLTLFLPLPMFLMYLRTLFPQEFPKPFIHIVQLFSISLAIITILTPSKVFSTYTSIPYYIVLIGSLLLSCVCLLIAMIRRRESAYLVFAGALVSIMIVGLDVVSTQRFFSIPLPQMTPFGLFLLILSQSYLLSRRFAKTYQKLDDLTRHLDKKVQFRTQELQVAKNKIEQSNQEKTDFFTNLSHEVKTPLTLISNYLNLFMEKHQGEDFPELTVVKRNLDKLLQDMLNFFDILKFERGAIPYNHSSILNLHEIIAEKALLFKVMAEKNFITIKPHLQNNIFIKADSLALDRVVNNLLDNAIKFNHSGGEINIALYSADGMAVLEIKDDGCGIDSSEMENIFKPYYQMSHQKSSAQGIGMGLALVKQIIDSLKGKIDVESNPDYGSTFFVRIPQYSPGSFEKQQTEHAISEPLNRQVTFQLIEDSPHDPHKKTVLFVEDNLDLLYVVRQQLKSKFNILCAANGQQALEKLQNDVLPDIVVSDIMMDHMDGYELIGRLMDDSRLNKIPFLFTTAKTAERDKMKGLNSGAIDYINKPYTTDTLIIKIESLLRFQSLQKERFEKEKFTSIGMMLGGISHEIYNPLSGISGPLENLKKTITQSGLKDNLKINKYFGYIEENIVRIKQLIENVKILFHDQTLDLELLSIKEVFAGLMMDSTSANGKKSAIICQVREDYEFSADKRATNLIFSNLIANSLQAVNDNGKIELIAFAENGKKIIQVKDNGSGIKSEDRTRIFEAFYTTKPISSSEGLGLFIVKNLIEKMNWRISVDSQIGTGSTFTIVIGE